MSDDENGAHSLTVKFEHVYDKMLNLELHAMQTEGTLMLYV